MVVNPFTYGNPISNPPRFFGREHEVEQVFSRLRNVDQRELHVQAVVSAGTGDSFNTYVTCILKVFRDSMRSGLPDVRGWACGL